MDETEEDRVGEAASTSFADVGRPEGEPRLSGDICRCGKRGYASRKEARMTVKKVRGMGAGGYGGRVTVYRCPDTALFHTSTSRRRKK
jgi:hypothetical protein